MLPVSDQVQVVRHDSIYPNDYNPNSMTYEERHDLKVSLLMNGFNRPILVRTTGEIIDGEQSWTVVSGEITPVIIEEAWEEAKELGEGEVPPDIQSRLITAEKSIKSGVTSLLEIMGGYIPILVQKRDDSLAMLDTIRANNAAGTPNWDGIQERSKGLGEHIRKRLDSLSVMKRKPVTINVKKFDRRTGGLNTKKRVDTPQSVRTYRGFVHVKPQVYKNVILPVMEKLDIAEFDLESLKRIKCTLTKNHY